MIKAYKKKLFDNPYALNMKIKIISFRDFKSVNIFKIYLNNKLLMYNLLIKFHYER